MFTILQSFNGSPDQKEKFLRHVLPCLLPQEREFTETVKKREEFVPHLVSLAMNSSPTKYKKAIHHRTWSGTKIMSWPQCSLGVGSVFVVETENNPLKPQQEQFVAVIAVRDTRKPYSQIHTAQLEGLYNTWTKDVTKTLCGASEVPCPELKSVSISGIRMEQHYVGLSSHPWPRSFVPRVTQVFLPEIGWFPTNNQAHILSSDRAIMHSLGMNKLGPEKDLWGPGHTERMALSLLGPER